MDLNVDESLLNNVFEQCNYDFSSRTNNIYILNSLMDKKENIQQILDVIKQIDENKTETRNKIKKGVAYQNSALQNKQVLSKSDNKVSLPKILNQSVHLSPPKSTKTNTFHVEKRSSTLVVKIRPFKDDSFNKLPIQNSNVKASSISPAPKVKSSTSSLSL